MFLRNSKNKIYGIQFGKEGGNWFFLRVQFGKPTYLYFFIKFLPLPKLMFHRTGAPVFTCHPYHSVVRGEVWLEGLALRIFWTDKKFKCEFDEMGFVRLFTCWNDFNYKYDNK